MWGDVAFSSAYRDLLCWERGLWLEKRSPTHTLIGVNLSNKNTVTLGPTRTLPETSWFSFKWLQHSVVLFLFAGQRPFKCSYCPYSASQKGNLKTHVLCVHRMPFDNSQYPDRRFKRSRPESDIPEKNPDDAVSGVTSNQQMTAADASNGNNDVSFAGEATSRHQ